MFEKNSIRLRMVFSLMLMIGLFYMPVPVFSQDQADLKNVILNGGFEEGFQGEFGVC